MRITKFGHSCVRIEHDGKVLVIDPGGFTSPESVDGVDAVLITHEHPDHVSADLLRRTDAEVFTIRGVADHLAAAAPDVHERVHVLAPGTGLTVAGLQVETVGELHAVIHEELPRVHNSGFLVSDGQTRLFHPGDALTAPGEHVDVLCLPVCAPWMKISEAIDFARGVGAARNLAIHDEIYSARGLAVADGHLGRFLGAAGHDYARLPEGADLG
ncbi:MBL fold metallo-hydrolase [Nocardioides phosphati]|uniref:MBL fold metallo-hydrolase n=1 Tax=Nocardioides phosphati TaxID=1867775 RepID=A0ABQ2NG26_9ACTN|nr:MBL fold metallo-hydrolase [Nocardioides phosphati]GGO94205.1 MBL fold metallo-hydrolase [Nocardioides phosphati]